MPDFEYVSDTILNYLCTYSVKTFAMIIYIGLYKLRLDFYYVKWHSFKLFCYIVCCLAVKKIKRKVKRNRSIDYTLTHCIVCIFQNEITEIGVRMRWDNLNIPIV